ncbi:MAG: hypothetical protein O3A59_15325, partial [Nitrospirae bacterium]|nr:hypothetical protein [Nitrospirota bacterium]
MHRTTKRFWQCFEVLPISVQELSKKNFELLKANPSHPSLHFKKIGKFWSARVGMSVFKVAAVSVIMAFSALFFYSY